MLCTRLTVSNPHLGLWRISQPDVAPWSLLHPSLPFPPRRPNWKWSASSHPPPRRGRQLHPLYSLSEKQWWVNCSPAGGPPGGAVHSESSQSCTAHVLYIKASQPRLLLTYELPKKGCGGGSHLFQEAVMPRNLNSAETRVNHWVQDKALTFEGRLHRHLQQTESLTFTST